MLINLLTAFTQININPFTTKGVGPTPPDEIWSPGHFGNS